MTCFLCHMPSKGNEKSGAIDVLLSLKCFIIFNLNEIEALFFCRKRVDQRRFHVNFRSLLLYTCFAKMLRLCSLSGETLATLSADEVEGTWPGAFSKLWMMFGYVWPY